MQILMETMDLIVMCQHWFTHYNNVLLIQDVDSRGCSARDGWQEAGTVCFPLNFALNLKLLLKIKSINLIAKKKKNVFTPGRTKHHALHDGKYSVFSIFQKVSDWFCQKTLASTVGSLGAQQW